MSQSLEKNTAEQGLWREGALFHRFKREGKDSEGEPVDRLREILTHGLIAPGCDSSGIIRSDLNISVTGTKIPYDGVVFLHRYSEELSLPYTISRDPQDVFVFIDGGVDYMTPKEMGDGWPVMSMDEVYVVGSILPESIGAIAVQESMIAKVTADIHGFDVAVFDLSGQKHTENI